MSAEVAGRCVELLVGSPVGSLLRARRSWSGVASLPMQETHTFDLTGGAPELNAQFRPLVESARAKGFEGQIIDRCNLTVLVEPGQEDLVDFLVQHRVRVVVSQAGTPCARRHA